MELFNSYIKRFKQHHFNIKQQYAFWKRALIHVDFSENYSCKYSSQVQAVHFGASHQQATLHTGVLYVGRHPEPVCFNTISPSRHKGPPAIWQHLHPVLDYLQAQHPQVSVLHFLSDGPCTEYKQRGAVRRGFKAGSWKFSEASHRKGAPDGAGGGLKKSSWYDGGKGPWHPRCSRVVQGLDWDKHNSETVLWKVKMLRKQWRTCQSWYQQFLAPWEFSRSLLWLHENSPGPYSGSMRTAISWSKLYVHNTEAV